MTAAPTSTLDSAEVAKFVRIAEQWWDPNGLFRPLHRFNPARLSYIRRSAAAHFDRDPRAIHAFEGLTLLDIGCGGGLVAEPMARIGFAVLGIDASEKNIGIAATHARDTGLPLTYRAATPEALVQEGRLFDLVLNLEVVEHVPDVPSFLEVCAKLVAPDGAMIVATLNRTLKSLLLAKLGAEYVLGWLPKGTHDWNRFVPPLALKAALEDAGLSVSGPQGVSFDPVRWEWRLSDQTDINYMVTAKRSAR